MANLQQYLPSEYANGLLLGQVVVVGGNAGGGRKNKAESMLILDFIDISNK